MKYLAMTTLGQLCINSLWKFGGFVCFYLICSAIPKQEKKTSFLSNYKVIFYLEAEELFEVRTVINTESVTVLTAIPSRSNGGFSCQVENNVQTPLSSCCPTLGALLKH